MSAIAVKFAPGAVSIVSCATALTPCSREEAARARVLVRNETRMMCRCIDREVCVASRKEVLIW